MCEIRFSVGQKDGKLERMLNCIPSNIRTEVIKEAIRYFLNDVRDNKVESDYIDSDILSSFRTKVQEPIFTINDMFKILDSRTIQQSLSETVAAQSQQIINSSVNQEMEENQDEFDMDLSQNQFDNNIDTISTDDINMNDLEW